MKNTIFILILLLIISCATPYRSKGFLGGYESYPNSDNTYSIGFRGNGYTSSQTTWLFFLTRASEIAIEEDYKYFYVINSNDFSREYQYVTPGKAQSTSTGTITGDNIFLRTNTHITPPQIRDVKKAAFSGTILLVNEPIDGYPNVYDAHKIYEVGMKKNKSVLGRNTIIMLSCLLPFMIFL